MTLLPGDMILTGTPSGVGPMSAGQTVSVTIEGIGTLSNPVLGAMTEPVRLRFAPSPTGDLHVGNVRSALFNWAFARHAGGAFVLRIEDTDAARSTEASYRGVLDSCAGSASTGTRAPRSAARTRRTCSRSGWTVTPTSSPDSCDAGYAYESYSTDEEVRARRAARGDKTQGYDNYDRELTAAQISAFRTEGRTPVVRFRMPDEAVVFEDMVRGEVRFEPENVPDYVLTRADGSPLYPLTNPVDDAVMGITHVLRGDDLLPSTPRQIPLHAALRSLGIASGPMPRVRAPADGARRGPAAAVQAEDARGVAGAHAGRGRSCPRASSTTSRCSAGPWAATGSCSRWRRWSRRSPSRRSPGTRPPST